MDKFVENLKGLINRIDSVRASIQTEEATKTAIVMPFFQILGYDVFNPTEFSPEFTADVGIKKGEKVDYAILSDNAPIILIECKSINEKLTKHDSQLFRYFSTTTAKFGILTNGIEYKFFTDLEEPNKMDSLPFFSFNILELRDNQIQEIAKFRKETFDLEHISSTASDLKYLNALKEYLSAQFDTPEEDFVKFFVQKIYDGLKTKNTLEKFTPIISKGLKQIITEKVNDKLNAALTSTGDTKVRVKLPDPQDEVHEIQDSQIEVQEVITTPEELETYSVVKIILKDVISPNRLYYRDNKSYFNIIVDNNIRKWILRVYFEKNRNFIVLNDAPTDKERTQIEFNEPMDILNFSEKLIPLVSEYIEVNA